MSLERETPSETIRAEAGLELDETQDRARDKAIALAQEVMNVAERVFVHLVSTRPLYFNEAKFSYSTRRDNTSEVHAALATLAIDAAVAFQSQSDAWIISHLDTLTEAIEVGIKRGPSL